MRFAIVPVGVLTLLAACGSGDEAPSALSNFQSQVVFGFKDQARTDYIRSCADGAQKMDEREGTVGQAPFDYKPLCGCIVDRIIATHGVMALTKRLPEDEINGFARQCSRAYPAT